MSNHREIIEALHRGARSALGDLCPPKAIGNAQAILAAQCRELIDRDPMFKRAVGMVVAERLEALLPGDHDGQKRLATDPHDADHAYWLLVVPDRVIRRSAHRCEGPMDLGDVMQAIREGRAHVVGAGPVVGPPPGGQVH